MKHVLRIDSVGNVTGLSSDVIDKLDSLGPKTAERVSNIEFNADVQLWVAYDANTGETIATDKIRSKVIEKEHEHYNKLLMS